IQPLDALRNQKISIGYKPGDNSIASDTRDDRVELRVKQWLSSAYRDHGSSHRSQPVDPAEHFLNRHGFREVVEFVAVRARQIAPPHWNDVDQQRMLRRGEALCNHARLAHLTVSRKQLPSYFLLECHGLQARSRRVAAAPPSLI